MNQQSTSREETNFHQLTWVCSPVESSPSVCAEACREQRRRKEGHRFRALFWVFCHGFAFCPLFCVQFVGNGQTELIYWFSGLIIVRPSDFFHLEVVLSQVFFSESTAMDITHHLLDSLRVFVILKALP